MKNYEMFNSVILLSLVINLLISFSEGASIAPIKKADNKVEAAIEEKIPEIPVSIKMEDGEESDQARDKKSATTTFCVEIRPESSKTPVNICENPTSSSSISQITHKADEINEEPSSSSTDNQNLVVPIFISSNPDKFFIPSISSQYVNVPSVVHNPQNVVSNFNPQFYSQCPCASGFRMAMRSNVDETSNMNSVTTIPSNIQFNQDFQSEFVGSLFSGGHLTRHHPLSLHRPSYFHHRKFPYIIRNNPVSWSSNNRGTYVLSPGLRFSNEAFNPMNNEKLVNVGNYPMNMEILEQARNTVIQPMVQPYINTEDGYSHSIIPSVVHHTSYENPLDSYTIQQHSVLPEYSVNPHQSSVIVPGISVNSHPAIIS